MEEYLAATLTQDAELQAFFGVRPPEDWFYLASSLGEGEVPQMPTKPFVIYNELPDRPYDDMRRSSTTFSRMRSWNITVQDFKGDFTRINNILIVVRRIVRGMTPFQLPDGTIGVDSVWGGISGNLTDEQYDSCLKFGVARFTVNR